jgi:hypothetical protein
MPRPPPLPPPQWRRSGREDASGGGSGLPAEDPSAPRPPPLPPPWRCRLGWEDASGSGSRGANEVGSGGGEADPVGSAPPAGVVAASFSASTSADPVEGAAATSSSRSGVGVPRSGEVWRDPGGVEERRDPADVEGLAGFVRGFCFFYSINSGGQQTVVVKWSFTLTFGRWRLEKPPPLIDSARHGKVLCSSAR